MNGYEMLLRDSAITAPRGASHLTRSILHSVIWAGIALDPERWHSNDPSGTVWYPVDAQWTR